MNLRDLPQPESHLALHGPPLPPKLAARRLATEGIRDQWRSEGLHAYTDGQGQILYWRIRVRRADGRKWIRPMSVRGMVYEMKEPDFGGKPKPLYRLHELTTADRTTPIWYVEGEQKADRLAGLGFVATTAGGANDDEMRDCEPLRGRRVIVWPDNDAPGHAHAQRVAAKLRALGCKVEIIDIGPLGLPAGGDVIDYLARHPDAVAGDLEALPKLQKFLVATKAAGGWPDLDPLPEPSSSRGTPFPFDGLGSVLGPAAKAIARDVQAPDAIAGASVLAAAALAAQPLADLQLSHARVPLSLFTLTAAQSGDRKSATDAVACREVNELRKEQAREHARLTPTESGKQAPAPSLIVSKATVEGVQSALRWQPHIGLFSSEGAELLAGHSMRDERRSAGIAFLCKGWDGGVLDTATKGDGMIVLLNRRVTISTMVQPIVLARLLSDPMAQGQGLIARFLVAQPETLAGTRLYRDVDPHSDPAVQRYHGAMRTLLRLPPPLNPDGDGQELSPRPIALERPAQALWREFHDDVERLQAPGQELALCRPFASKAAEQAARIAGVLQLVSDPCSNSVTESSMACGIVVARFYLLEHVRLTGASVSARKADQLRELLAWMQSRSPAVSTADLLQRVPHGLRLLKAEGLKPLLDELTGRNYIRPASRGWEIRDAG